MSDSGPESNDVLKESVHDFCLALSGRNLSRLENTFAENASLHWGPYNFTGRGAIISWAKELYELFPFMSIQHKSIQVHNGLVKQELVIAFLTADKQRGWLPCTAEYSFDEDRIRDLKVTLLNGYLAVSRNDVVGAKSR